MFEFAKATQRTIVAREFRKQHCDAHMELTKTKDGYMLKVVAGEEKQVILDEKLLAKLITKHAQLGAIIGDSLGLGPIMGSRFAIALTTCFQPHTMVGRKVVFQQDGSTRIVDPAL